MMTRCYITYILLLTNCIAVISQIEYNEENYSTSITIKNQENINTANTDFAPSYWTDYIVFSSSKKRQKIFDPNTNEAFFDLYLTAINKENELARSAQLSKVLNTPYHEATSCFTQNDKHIYFSRMTEEGLMYIYESDYVNGEWNDAVPSIFNEEGSQALHPTVNESGDIIIFASDRDGGYGSMDLYFSYIENGEWAEPQNLGPNINTKENELFPFMAQNNVLFFSSNGHHKQDDLNIYKTTFDISDLHDIHLLPFPINSKYDDLSLICNYEGKSGFFSSNRPGGVGKDDIYKFDAQESLLGYGDASYNLISIFVKDTKTKEALSNVILRYRHLEEGETLLFDKSLFDISKTLYDSTMVDNKGRAQIKLNDGYTLIEAEAPNKERWQVAVTNKLEDKTLDIYLSDLAPPQNEITIPKPIPSIKHKDLNVGTILVFDNIYYDYNSHEIKKGAALELDELIEAMQLNTKLKIQLSSHTDSRGEDDYNLLLSERRAVSAKEYLMSKGIHPNRISTIGYGENKLRNHCKDGVFCTEEDHLFNRRTEVKILEN